MGPFQNDYEQLLQRLCEAGELSRALDLLSHMHSPPSHKAYIALLKACSKNKALHHAKRVHAHLALHRTHMSGFLGEHLVTTLAKCGAVDDACQVSALLPCRTVLSWTALIAAYAELGQLHKALKMYQCMQDDGVEPSNYTFVSLCKACGSVLDIEQGKKVHVDARRKGLASDAFVCAALLSMYGKCGAFVEAEDTFCAVIHRDTVAWNTMLSTYVKQCQPEKTLHLYRQMQEEGQFGDHLTFVIALQACGVLVEKGNDYFKKEKPVTSICLEIAHGLHADARKMGFESHILVGNTLVSVYGKCGATTDAHGVFLTLSERAIISWNAMLTVYVGQGKACTSLQLYMQMQEEGASPNQLTFLLVFQACGLLIEKEPGFGMQRCLRIVQALHTDTCTTDFALDVLVATPLLQMYAKCGSIAEAEDVFCALPYRDVVTWTAMLSAYAEHGQGEKALQLYALMQSQGMSPNQLTCVVAFQACGILAYTERFMKGGIAEVKRIGHTLHIDTCFRGFSSDMLVGTGIISMYAKCGALVEAEYVFNALSQRDTVAWNAMLSVYVELQQGESALLLYREMREQLVTMDDGTIVCLLQACGKTGSLETTKQLHFAVVIAGCNRIPTVAATLIDAYGGCGNIVDANIIFDELFEPDLVFWTAYLCGHAGQGDAVASMAILEEIKLASNKPDDVVLTLVLTSCSHAGLVVEGMEYFNLMNRDQRIRTNVKHYAILLDLFGRAGDFKRIKSVLVEMPMQADLTIWLCLLGACHMHGHIELAKEAFKCAVNLGPKEGSAYVLMSNASANDDLLDYALEMEDYGPNDGG